MAEDEISPEGRAARFAQWDKIGLDRIKADLETGGHRLVGGPPAVRELAWEWVHLREAEKEAAAKAAQHPDEWIKAAEALAMLKPVFGEYKARHRICERAHGGLIHARAEQFHIDKRVYPDWHIPKEFWWAEGRPALEQDWAAGDFSTWINDVKWKAFGVTFTRPDIEKLLPPTHPADAKTKAVALSDEDHQLIARLDALVPSAALSYKQAILDLADQSRVSFRGPALELREALREILDHLARDSEVMAEPGYKQEKEKPGPTMRQKARFIMRMKAGRSPSDAPEKTVAAFEEKIATLTRAVYQMSSEATHVAGERQTVVQLRRYVVVILHDILEEAPRQSPPNE
jgi:hypothetical protein